MPPILLAFVSNRRAFGHPETRQALGFSFPKAIRELRGL